LDELAGRETAPYICVVTATEIIGQIKALPPEERAKVVHFIHELEAVWLKQTMDPKTFEKSATQAFDRHAALMHKLSL
jgi:hypothetical protein